MFANPLFNKILHVQLAAYSILYKILHVPLAVYHFT